MKKLTPEEAAIHAWGSMSGEGFIRLDSPANGIGGRGLRLTPEEQSIHDRDNGIIPIDETEPDSVREQRARIAEATESILGEELMEGERGDQGWYYAGGVAPGFRHVIRNANGIPRRVATAPCSYDDLEAYECYTVEIQRDADGEPVRLSYDFSHRQQYNGQHAPEEYDIPLPTILRGELTVAGKQAAQWMAEKGLAQQPAKQEPKDAPRPPMPTRPFAGFRKKG